MFKSPKSGDEADTVIVRPSATTLFAVSSSDRYSTYKQRRDNPTSPFSFNIQKNQALMNGYFRRLAMSEFRMNWTLPNICSAWGNDIINFNYINTSAGAITNAVLGNLNIVKYGVASSAAFKVGNIVTVAGITGGTNYNNPNLTVTSIDDSTHISVYYTLAVSGNPSSFSGASITLTSTPTFVQRDVSGLYITYNIPNAASYVVGNVVTVAGVTGGVNYNGNFTVNQVLGNSIVVRSGLVVGGTPNISAATITITQAPTSSSGSSTLVTYTVANTDNYAVGQLVTITGLTVAGTGYNGQATVSSITSGTVIVVSYTTPNSGTISSYTGSSFTFAANFQIVLQDGFYGAEELATALQYEIQSGGYPTASPFTFVPGISNFIVQVSTQSEDDQMVFISPGGISFWFTPIGNNTKELFDMLTLPNLTSPGVSQLYSGIPDLRATEYVDIVCTNLTNNMKQKDSSSSPISRDVLARIYTDDDVPSQSLVTTNIYNTTLGSSVITAVTVSGLFYNFTLSTAASSNYSTNEIAFVTGVTGGENWNGEVIVRNIPSTSNVVVSYSGIDNPGGTPTFSGSSILKGTLGSLTSTSTPVTTWDDRVNGVTPFVLYRQFPVPKQIRWEHTQPIGNLKFEMYDSQGRSMAELWASYNNGAVVTDITAVTNVSSSVATFTVVSIAKFNLGNIVVITGLTNCDGYNNTGNISAINISNNTITVSYGNNVALSGTPVVTNGALTTAVDYTSSFAWNFSMLCSED